MTQQSNKESERFYVERAGELLGKTWGLEDREPPDFIVTEGVQQFGLEVCYIFTDLQNQDESTPRKGEKKTKTGPKRTKGSRAKERESNTQQVIDALQSEYESKEKIPLIVKFVGNMCDENMAAVVPALLAMGLSDKPYGHQDLIDVDEGRARLRVHVTRALRADWFSVNDRVGWVNINPIDHIVRAIKKKSENLHNYKKCTGLDDIRLLIVANHIFRSGMLTLQERTELDLQGFQFVYFFSYPESITVFDCTGNTARSHYLRT